MNSSILLNEGDVLCLRSLVKHLFPPPYPSQVEESILEGIVECSEISHNSDLLERRVGLLDQVTLVSPKDSRDYYRLTLVLPHEADVDADRISVCKPVSLAILGRSAGEIVHWITPSGVREMRIISILKHEPTTVRSIPADILATH